MKLPNPPAGRNMHRPQIGDTVRITVDALVMAVSNDGNGITVGAPLHTTLHRDQMCIINYHQETGDE